MATARQFGQCYLHLLNARVNWPSDDVRVGLFNSGYTPDFDAHDFYDDTTAGTHEVVGTGYTANGQALAGKATSYDSATDQCRATASDTTWTGVTLTAGEAPRYAVVYNRQQATDATRPLLSYVNFGADQSISGVNFTIDWDATGILRGVAGAEA